MISRRCPIIDKAITAVATIAGSHASTNPILTTAAMTPPIRRVFCYAYVHGERLYLSRLWRDQGHELRERPQFVHRL